MSKLSKAFKALGLILKKPYLLNLILDSEEVYKNYVEKKYGFGKGLPTADISEFIDNSEIVEPYSFLEGSSLITDFALLRALCKKYAVEDYLEIGTWRGESVANVAPLVKNCISINLSDEEMRRRGFDESYIGMHRFFSKNLPNVKHIGANSLTFDFTSLNQKFDLIFLDGDHHTQAVASDTSNAFKLLKNENSIIVWHDYGTGTETPRYSVLAGILDGTPTEYRQNIFHVSHTLCAVFSLQKIPFKHIPINHPPSKYFSVQLTIKKNE